MPFYRTEFGYLESCLFFMISLKHVMSAKCPCDLYTYFDCNIINFENRPAYKYILNHYWCERFYRVTDFPAERKRRNGITGRTVLAYLKQTVLWEHIFIMTFVSNYYYKNFSLCISINFFQETVLSGNGFRSQLKKSRKNYREYGIRLYNKPYFLRVFEQPDPAEGVGCILGSVKNTNF